MNKLKASLSPRFLVILRAQTRADDDSHELYIHLEKMTEDSIVHDTLQQAGLQLCGATGDSAQNVDNIGNVDRHQRQISAIKRLLELAGGKYDIRALDRTGRKVSKLIDEAQAALAKEQAARHNGTAPTDDDLLAMSKAGDVGAAKTLAAAATNHTVVAEEEEEVEEEEGSVIEAVPPLLCDAPPPPETRTAQASQMSDELPDGDLARAQRRAANAEGHVIRIRAERDAARIERDRESAACKHLEGLVTDLISQAKDKRTAAEASVSGLSAELEAERARSAQAETELRALSAKLEACQAQLLHLQLDENARDAHIERLERALVGVEQTLAASHQRAHEQQQATVARLAWVLDALSATREQLDAGLKALCAEHATALADAADIAILDASEQLGERHANELRAAAAAAQRLNAEKDAIINRMVKELQGYQAPAERIKELEEQKRRAIAHAAETARLRQHFEQRMLDQLERLARDATDRDEADAIRTVRRAAVAIIRQGELNRDRAIAEAEKRFQEADIRRAETVRRACEKRAEEAHARRKEVEAR